MLIERALHFKRAGGSRARSGSNLSFADGCMPRRLQTIHPGGVVGTALSLRLAKTTPREFTMLVPSILSGSSLKRLLQGVALGAAATMIVGFNWGGWVLGSTAQA